MTQKETDAINDVMDEFDFHKVQKIMETLDWKWALEDALRVPTESEVRKFARRLLEDAIKRNSTMASGGFKAKYIKKYNELSLKFVVEEVCIYNDQYYEKD